jgi:hypothetical protein
LPILSVAGRKLLEAKVAKMSISPKGWLALLISLALHGIAIGFFCWLASRNQAQVTPVALPQFVHAQDEFSMTTFVMGQRTEVMELPPKAKPSAPGKIENVSQPAGPIAPPKPPAPFPEAIKAQASPIDNPGAASSAMGVAHAGAGTVATTTFFAVPAKGRRIVYLIDHSASMGPSGALEVAGQELLASLGRLPTGTGFQIIVYNRAANLLLPRFPDWISVHADAIKQVAAAWNDLPAEGGTDHVRALKLALAQGADVIFFLTDAGDVRADQLGEITRLNQGRTVIHVIQLNGGQRPHDDGPMQRLARENRGTFQSVLVR